MLLQHAGMPNLYRTIGKIIILLSNSPEQHFGFVLLLHTR